MEGDKDRDKGNFSLVRRKWHSLVDHVLYIGSKQLGKSLKINCGAHYMPKGKRLGDDAHFICVKEQVIGIADGVSDWAKHGIDAGQYARELMDHAQTVVRGKRRRFFDPATILEKAYSRTSVMGSSTAIIIALNGQVMKVAVKPGDVIVAGTDGIFDNVFEDEVKRFVHFALTSHSQPQELASILANTALTHSNSTTVETPYSKAAQEAGRNYTGGKRDDFTVVVMYLSSDA